MKSRFITGAVLIDLEPGLLNNYLENNGENVIQTIHGENYAAPFSSMPWRQCLKKAIMYENNWKYSTEIDPVSCQLQDLFGYVGPKNPKNKNFCGQLSRESVFKTSILTGLNQKPKFSQSRAFNSQYSTAFGGIFNIECNRIGTYTNLGDYKELDELYIEKCLKGGLIEEVSIKNRADEIYQLTDIEKQRIDRTSAILKAIANTKCGSDQNSYNIDLSPKLMLFTGSNVGSVIFRKDTFEQDGKKVSISIEVLEESIRMYSKRICGNIYMGVENGFLENESELIAFSDGLNGKLIINSPKNAVELFIEKELLEN